MRSLISAVVSIILFVFIFSVNSFAEENVNNDLSYEIGIDFSDLDNFVPSDAAKIIEQNGIFPENAESITKITPYDVFKYMIGQLKSRISYPLKLMATFLAVIIAAAVTQNFGSCLESKGLSGVYENVCVLIAVGIVSEPIINCVNTAADTLYSGSEFITSYVPIFSGIIASSGSVTSASVYSIFLVLCSELASSMAADLLMPFVSMCMALGIIEAINSNLNLTNITDFIYKAVKLVLGFMMTIFIGLLSLQSIIGASADTLGVKAAKYLVSNCVPVIGGAVADAYTTLKSSLGILRGGAGFFGIAVVFLSVFPTLAEIVLIRLAFFVAELVSGIFGIKGIKTLAHNSAVVLSVITSLLICFAMMLITATAVMMMVGLDVF